MKKRYDANGPEYTYCDWCGRDCTRTAINTIGHDFCSERCLRAYDKANGTVDGGYREGSFGHKLYKAGKKTTKLLETIVIILIAAVVILEFVVPRLDKWVVHTDSSTTLQKNNVPRPKEYNSYSFNGYLETYTGTQYKIDMALSEKTIIEKDQSWEVQGYYHYASQPKDKRINISGRTTVSGDNRLEFDLISESKTERFYFILNTESLSANGNWRKYDDPESCIDDSDDYKSSLKVILTLNK